MGVVFPEVSVRVASNYASEMAVEKPSARNDEIDCVDRTHAHIRIQTPHQNGNVIVVIRCFPRERDIYRARLSHA